MRPSRLLVVAASVAALAVAAPASAAPPEAEVTLTPLGTYRTGAFDEGASEIVAHDPVRQRLFVVNALAGTVDVLDMSDPTTLRKVASLATPGANSVAVHGRLVAVAQQAAVKTDPGRVSFFDADSYAAHGSVRVGALPDMVTFTRSGDRAVVANEGEPEGYCEGQVDPEGSVSVIDLRKGPAKATVRTAGFTAYNDDRDDLLRSGVRIYGPRASVAQDLEPEYVATSTRSQTAWVTLQENNAIATVDLRTATVTAITPLGLKDHSMAGSGLDASDKDGAVDIAPRPVKGMYQPDGVAAYQVKGRHYLVTANEGDARDFDCFAEEERVKDLGLDPAAFPHAKTLLGNDALGRLTVTSTSPRSEAGLTEIHALGGRSVSVRDARTGALMWDSGDAFEQVTAAYDRAHGTTFFNANNDDNDSFDSRSDNKGPEPEGLDLGRLGRRTYAFVGLERVSGIAVVDVTDPRRGRVAGYATNRVPRGDAEAGTAGDLGPEGVHFIRAEDSPVDAPLLVVGNEVSGTTTVWQVAATR